MIAGVLCPSNFARLRAPPELLAILGVTEDSKAFLRGAAAELSGVGRAMVLLVADRHPSASNPENRARPASYARRFLRRLPAVLGFSLL